MATQNHVVVPDITPASSTNVFNVIWKFTRALKKAGWKYMGSGNGTTKNTSKDPAADNWGGGVVTNAGAAAAVIAAPTLGRATVTGLTGIVAADKGRFLKISGSGTGANNNQHQIEEVLSASSVRIDARTFAVAADAGPLTWDIRDPLSDTYPSALDAVNAWWTAQGPSVIKVPITAAPVAGASGFTFLRGENIVQATTGFEGEIQGFVFNAGAGYLVVAPRLRGSGGGVYGLATGNAFTGGISGATVTQNGTALEYRHEIVIAKHTSLTQGSINICVAEPVGEGAANLFSQLMTSAGCTATVPPGGGGTGNTYPTFAWTMQGYTSSGAASQGTGHQTWNQSNSASPFGLGQVMCADAIEEQSWSSDGSWILAIGGLNGVGGTFHGFWFQRMDDAEDGDLSPFVTWCGDQRTRYSTEVRTQTNQSSSGGNFYDAFTSTNSINDSSGNSPVKGWRNRGLASGDAFQPFELCRMHAIGSGVGVLAANPTDAERVATAPVATKVREPVLVASVQVGKKMRKGYCRWLSWVSGGNGTDLYDGKRFVQLSPTLTPMVAGPWDGSSSAHQT